jgi:hypothetical protein
VVGRDTFRALGNSRDSRAKRRAELSEQNDASAQAGQPIGDDFFAVIGACV